MANSHSRFNCIERLVVDGVELVRENDIKDGIVHFYKGLYGENEKWRPRLNGLQFGSLSSID